MLAGYKVDITCKWIPIRTRISISLIMRTKITSCLIKNLLESRQNVLETASGCSRQYVGTYPLLRRDVISSTSSVKIAKKRLKTPSIVPGKRSFCSMLSYFLPQNSSKTPIFRWFYGKIWQIMAIQKAIAIPIYPYNQTVIEQYGNMAILERKTIIIQQIEKH